MLILIQRVGNETNQKDQFIIDLLSLPELLTGNTDEDHLVQDDFVDYIKSLVISADCSERLLLKFFDIKFEVKAH